MKIGVSIEFCNVNIHPKGTVVKGITFLQFSTTVYVRSFDIAKLWKVISSNMEDRWFHS